jgi:hypothetical protein
MNGFPFGGNGKSAQSEKNGWRGADGEAEERYLGR